MDKGETDIQASFAHALRRALLPLVRLMLTRGLHYPAAAELLGTFCKNINTFKAARFKETPLPALGRESNCVENQAFLRFWMLGFHGVLDLKMAFMMESNLYMQATKTTFLALPFSRSR